MKFMSTKKEKEKKQKKHNSLLIWAFRFDSGVI